MIVISDDVVLSQPEQFSLNHPVIGYDSRVTINNITASSEADSFPATNLANPATYLKWKASSSAAQTIDIALEGQTVEFVGIARHNLGSKQISVTVLTYDSTDSDGNPEWDVILADEQLFANDDPIMIRFNSDIYQGIRIELGAGSDAAQMAVLYVGPLLTLQRTIYVGHTPINFGVTSTIVGGTSENGQFMGRLLVSEGRSSAVSLKNLTPDWYRSYFEPFKAEVRTQPFFFAWRPQDYPNEVGYCWLPSEPKMTNTLSNGMVGVDLSLSGLA